MNVFREKTWSPYAAGALAGLLLILSVFITGKYFGASTPFVRVAGYVEQTVNAGQNCRHGILHQNKTKIDWQFHVCCRNFLRRFGRRLAVRRERMVAVPKMWEERFGPSRANRWTAAFLGGIVLMFGARLADGDRADTD